MCHIYKICKINKSQLCTMTQPCTHKTKSKPKPKVAAKKQQQANLEKTTKTQKKCGRSPDSDGDSSDPIDEESNDEEPVAKKARKKKCIEVEVVEDDVEPCKEEVENISAEEVSYDSMIILNT